MATAGATHRESGPIAWDDWSAAHRWRITASILGPVAWLCFTLVYVGFWAQGFSLFQSIVVVLVSALVLAGLMGALWTWWAPVRASPTA
ncbi:MAG TPA: hypothetical protein VMH90_00040 [Thermoplasmata archaeon]|nr:hypothetical protein [Thermoplasmata archaeon]